MAGWTAAGLGLDTDTKGKNKCCWIELNTGKHGMERNMNHMQLYHQIIGRSTDYK